MTNTICIGRMKVGEVLSKIGCTVMTQELGGDIFISTLERVNLNESGAVRSIVVRDGDMLVVWPTQWYQAVFVG